MFGLFESNEQKAEKFYRRGLAEFRCHNSLAALECLQHAVDLDPRHACAWHDMSVLVGQRGGDWTLAKQYMEKAITIEPERFPDAWKGLAIIEKQLGNEERATELFKMVIDKYGWDPSKDLSIKDGERTWLEQHGCYSV